MTWTRWLCCVALAGLTACAAEVEDVGESGAPLLGLSRVPVVFDTDMDIDDTSALLYLCQEHHRGRIDLRAVTVTNAGAGTPGSAIQNARCVLEVCGLPDVPVADSSEPGENPTPPEVAGVVTLVLGETFAECTASEEPSSVSAPELILDTIRSSRRRVVVLTTGPLTNVAAAFDLDDEQRRGPPMAARIRRLVIMGGAVDTAGNLFGTGTEGFDGSQELNIWLDPPAAERVLDAARPWSVRLVPLDATNHVPVTASFAARLADDRVTPEAETVHQILSHPVAQFGIELGAFYWWDPLAATVAAGRRGLVDFELARIEIETEGAAAGRTYESRHGARVLVGVAADGDRFEDVFLNVLNGRPVGRWPHHWGAR